MFALIDLERSPSRHRRWRGGRMPVVDCIATIGQLCRSPCLFLRCGDLSGPRSCYQQRCGTISCRTQRCVARVVDPRPKTVFRFSAYSVFGRSANDDLCRPRRVPNIPHPLPHHPPAPAHLHRRLPRTGLDGTDSNYRRPRGLRRRHVLGPPRHGDRQHASGRGWHDELFGGAYACLLSVLAVIP